MTETTQSFWELIRTVDASQIKLLAESNLLAALALCFVSGLLTSLTPCVYPMIPITINIFGRLAQRQDSQRFNLGTFKYAAVYVAGMCTTYSGMGLVAGLTGSLFGQILQSSFFLFFLTLLFFTLALGQFGLFKLQLPPSLQTKIAGMGNTQSAYGIFLMGLFSGLIVSPCVGPVIAGILAFVLDSSNALKGFLYFLSFSLGLGVLFLVIGGFSGALSKLPRSGAWMLRVNRLLAALMLGAAAYYGFLFAKQVGWLKTTTSQVASTQSTWMTDETAAKKLARDRGVPLILDFTAEWCEACHVLDKTVFQDPTVAEKFPGFVLLRLDVTTTDSKNEDALQRYGVQSLPAVVFVSRSGEVLEQPRVHGVISPQAFLDMLSQL